jgi:TolA-binding protein
MLEQEADAKTEQAYKSVIEKYPNSAAMTSAALELGDFYVSKGLWEQAVFYFETGIQKSREQNDKPKETVILYKLGQAYEGMGKSEKTIQLYSDFVKTADANDLGTKMINARLAALQGGKK